MKETDVCMSYDDKNKQKKIRGIITSRLKKFHLKQIIVKIENIIIFIHSNG